MKLEVRHTGMVKGGKFRPDNADFFKHDVASFEGQLIEVMIIGRRNTRSLRMNRYYWGVVVRMLVDFFNQENTFGRHVNAEYVHEILAVKFLGTKKIMMPDHEIIEVRESSTDLDNQDFINYFENVRMWALELFNLDIPEPNEQL